jgi:RNA recognition motif-containing protein
MKLYVGNLSFNTTQQDLSDLFAQHGTVTDCAMIMDRETNRPRGFAFVTMSSAEEGQRAIDALHGQSHDGRELTVNEARPMESRGPRRDFAGGKGGSGGGNRSGGGRNRY